MKLTIIQAGQNLRVTIAGRASEREWSVVSAGGFDVIHSQLSFEELSELGPGSHSIPDEPEVAE